MILLFLFGARYQYHHDIIGAQWGNLMIPLYDIIVFLFLAGFFPAGGLVVVVVVVVVVLVVVVVVVAVVVVVVVAAAQQHWKRLVRRFSWIPEANLTCQMSRVIFSQHLFISSRLKLSPNRQQQPVFGCNDALWCLVATVEDQEGIAMQCFRSRSAAVMVSLTWHICRQRMATCMQHVQHARRVRSIASWQCHCVAYCGKGQSPAGPRQFCNHSGSKKPSLVAGFGIGRTSSA